MCRPGCHRLVRFPADPPREDGHGACDPMLALACVSLRGESQKEWWKEDENIEMGNDDEATNEDV